MGIKNTYTHIVKIECDNCDALISDASASTHDYSPLNVPAMASDAGWHLLRVGGIPSTEPMTAARSIIACSIPCAQKALGALLAPEQGTQESVPDFGLQPAYTPRASVLERLR